MLIPLLLFVTLYINTIPYSTIYSYYTLLPYHIPTLQYIHIIYYYLILYVHCYPSTFPTLLTYTILLLYPIPYTPLYIHYYSAGADPAAERAVPACALPDVPARFGVPRQTGQPSYGRTLYCYLW